MLKGKNLLILAGVAAVGYYLYKKNMAAKVIAPPAAATNFTGDLNVLANQNFTGDLGVTQYQNASGPSDRQLNRLEKVMTRNPQRAQRMIKRMF